MERAPSGAPRFDLLLLGVGAEAPVGAGLGVVPGGLGVGGRMPSAWLLHATSAPPPTATAAAAALVHAGSLYPGGAATLADPAAAPWVQPVVKAKPPASVTLSLGVMNAARSVLVRRAGVVCVGLVEPG